MTGNIGRKDVSGSHSYRRCSGTDPRLSLQLLAKMVPATGAESSHRKSRTGQYGEVPTERDPESEVQLHHLPAAGAVRAVSLLPQLVLPADGAVAVHSGHPDRLPVHLLGSARLRANGHHLPRGGRRSASASAGSRGKLAEVQETVVHQHQRLRNGSQLQAEGR